MDKILVLRKNSRNNQYNVSLPRKAFPELKGDVKFLKLKDYEFLED